MNWSVSVLLVWAFPTVIGGFALGKCDSRPSQPVSGEAKLMNLPFLQFCPKVYSSCVFPDF